MAGRTRWVTRKTEVRLTRRYSFQISSVTWSAGRILPMPALLTRIATGPSCDSVVETRRCTSAEREI
jgi:hypothetical protein